MPEAVTIARSSDARTRGLTLIELMVAMTIFLILGGSLILFLRVGIQTWRVGEERREVFERSQAILDQMERDLLCTFADPSHGTEGVVDVLFLSDYDMNGRQRIRFVRTLAGEMRHPITRDAGTLTGALGDYDYIEDSMESKELLLRAPGGLQEIAYAMDPRPSQGILWRGVKSPIGGHGTLFDDENLYDFTELEEFEKTGDLVRSPLPRCRPFADGVMHLSFHFWGHETERWGDPGAGSGSPLDGWDSTRAILNIEEYGATFPSVQGSRHEHRDDVFPSRVQMLVTLSPARATRVARLADDIGPDDLTIRVDTTERYPDGAFQFIRIDQEWIRYDSRSSRSFEVSADGGRGARGTEALSHERGARVEFGYTFSRVIRIPATRFSEWGTERGRR